MRKLVAKVSSNPIPDLNADWGNDGTGLPYSGKAVQNFIKDELLSRLTWDEVEPDAASPDGITYLSTSAQTLDEQAKKQVIENLGLDTKLDDKLEATVVGSDTTTSEFPVLLAGYQELTNLQKQQVRNNLGMEEYINTLIQKYIETNKK